MFYCNKYSHEDKFDAIIEALQAVLLFYPRCHVVVNGTCIFGDIQLARIIVQWAEVFNGIDEQAANLDYSPVEHLFMVIVQELRGL